MFLRLFYSGFTLGASFVFSLTLWNINQPEKVRDSIYYEVSQLARLPMGIVLGASVKPNGEPSPMLEERILAAARLYHAHKIERVLISGDSTGEYYDEIKIIYKNLLAKGVKEKDMIRDGLGVRTLDSLYRARYVYSIDRAVIISQSYHLPRALFLAERFGLKAVGYAANVKGSKPQWKHRFREFMARYLAFFDIVFLDTHPQL